jgi:dolichol-phosphate mannosyltransferase
VTRDPLIDALVVRERYRDEYLRRHDPIVHDRMLWRAQAFRQLVHLLPGDSVLELGSGDGRFALGLAEVSRGENPILAVSFDRSERPPTLPSSVEFLPAAALPGPLQGRRFDFVVGMDLLDRRNCGWLLQQIHELLNPGGQLVLFESNPWNPVLRVRRSIARLVGRQDPRSLLSRPRLYELMSEVGFIRVFAIFHDFLYAPLTPRLVWLLRGLSIVLENAPAVQTMAGTILIHAQKPPRTTARPRAPLCTHDALRGAVSVVIPCRNEEMNVGPLVQRLREHFDDYIHEIIPVDDNSTDATAAVLRSLAAGDPRVRPVFRSPPNGVGLAIRDGFARASGRYVLSMDSDFQHLLPEIRDLFDAIAAGCDVAVGSRFSRKSVLLNYPFAKIVANRGFHLLAQLLFMRRFRDLTNNLKLMRREVADRLQLLEAGFAVNAETGLQPLLMGCRVEEVPISWINRTPDMGASSFRLVRVGGGYWRVLRRLWLGKVAGRGPYRLKYVCPENCDPSGVCSAIAEIDVRNGEVDR